MLPTPAARLVVSIEGMRTVHCVRAVFTALAGVEGITTADVERGRATIDHDGRTTCAAIADAVALVGYRATDCQSQRRTLPVL